MSGKIDLSKIAPFLVEKITRPSTLAVFTDMLQFASLNSGNATFLTMIYHNSGTYCNNYGRHKLIYENLVPFYADKYELYVDCNKLEQIYLNLLGSDAQKKILEKNVNSIEKMIYSKDGRSYSKKKVADFSDQEEPDEEYEEEYGEDYA